MGEDSKEIGCCVKQGACNEGQGGEVIGYCPTIDDKGNSEECCKLNLKCGMAGYGSVVYFQNPKFPSLEKDDIACKIQIYARPGVTQIRVDFLDFEFPRPNVKTGRCDLQNSMKIIAPSHPNGILGGLKNQGLCGRNTGQHLYIPVKPHDKIEIFVTVLANNKDESAYKWNLKFTQISAHGELTASLAAPYGCLQYFTESFGSFSSFNFDPENKCKFAPDQDYAICFANYKAGDIPCSISLRAVNFGLPVGGKDLKYCSEGTELVNPAADRDCCLDPSSSYLGIVGDQKHPHKLNLDATRRYWCGKRLGSNDQLVSRAQPFILKVYSGHFDANDLKKLKYDPIGFRLDYKFNYDEC